jgi:hypothetical protein
MQKCVLQVFLSSGRDVVCNNILEILAPEKVNDVVVLCAQRPDEVRFVDIISCIKDVDRNGIVTLDQLFDVARDRIEGPIPLVSYQSNARKRELRSHASAPYQKFEFTRHFRNRRTKTGQDICTTAAYKALRPRDLFGQVRANAILACSQYARCERIVLATPHVTGTAISKR